MRPQRGALALLPFEAIAIRKQSMNKEVSSHQTLNLPAP